MWQAASEASPTFPQEKKRPDEGERNWTRASRIRETSDTDHRGPSRVVTLQAGSAHPGGRGAGAGRSRTCTRGRLAPALRAGPQGLPRTGDPAPRRLQTPGLTPRSPDQSRRRPWGCTVKVALTGDQRVPTRRTRSLARRPPKPPGAQHRAAFPGSAPPRDLALPGGPGPAGPERRPPTCAAWSATARRSGYCRTPLPCHEAGRRPGTRESGRHGAGP